MSCYLCTVTLNGQAVFTAYHYAANEADARRYAMEQGERLKICEGARGDVGASLIEIDSRSLLASFQNDE